jgi:Ca2+:H+ antiporter
MKAEEHAAAAAGLHPSVRSTLIQRATPQAVVQHVLPMHKDRPDPATGPSSPTIPTTSTAHTLPAHGHNPPRTAPPAPTEDGCRISSQTYNLPAGYTPFLETVHQDLKQPNVTPMRLPSALTTEDFTRAVAAATVTALRHQGSILGTHHGAVRKERAAALPQSKEEEEEEEGGGHEAPSWTRGVSAGVLLGCTLLYAIIAGESRTHVVKKSDNDNAEILVDCVDVVLSGSGIDEKFLGLTLFTLVPNTTEFMNAMSFAMNGNIALRCAAHAKV